MSPNLFHLSNTFFLKVGVADGKDFVNYEDLAFEVGCDRESKANGHPDGISLDRSIDVAFNTAEIDDLVELSIDLFLAHSEDRAIEIDIFAAREFRVKPGADLQQTGDASFDLYSAGRRRRNPGKDL